MAYGFKLYNSNGETLIDNEYINMSEYASGSSETISNGNNPGDWYDLTSFSATPNIPLVAFRPNTDYYSVVYGISKSGANYNGFYATTYYGQSTTIDWVVYTETLAASGESYGLKIYDDSSNIIFDAGNKYFRIAQVTTISLASIPTGAGGTGSTQTVNHAGISNPYYILTPIASTYTALPVYPYPPFLGEIRNWRTGVKKLSSTSCSVGFFPYVYTTGGTGGQREQGGYNPTAKLIVCDVLT